MITRRLGLPGSAALLLILPGAFLLLFLMGSGPNASEDSRQDQGESSSKRPDAPLPKDSSVKPSPEAEAERDIEVGEFYMRKGDRDAAIGRYQDAAAVAPNFGKPRLLLAEAFEKKGDKTAAVKYYKEYLQADPNTPDKLKIQKKIEKLSR